MHPATAGFGRAADAYERGRPSFPGEAVSFVASTLALESGMRLLELGAGTGKFTRTLAPTGATLVGLEPIDEMRRILTERVPTCRAIGGVAEQLPFRDDAFDAVAAAQVFHWLVGPRAVPELARVLRPGAGVALVWNVRDERRAWVAAITEVIEPFRGSAPAHRTGRWRESFAGSHAFTQLERRSFPYEHATTRDAVVDRIASISFVASLTTADRDRVVEAIRSILADEGAAEGNDAVTFPYRTDVWIARRR